ncbi:MULTISPECIES: lyase family protein [unclassified Microbacterium]|uniref:lyase family protein n=1 Tax=unclassified Microbacterium TaxID=2609290 RepID=UPI00214A8BEF|nr:MULTISPECIES: lyase family protein [unclassified Microbacterium]MCR2808519.1 lyase family protein [Microbacterium sp. zg.B185]WIM19041.1 lyase family protein [Microbacterium sp. zg-B185]
MPSDPSSAESLAAPPADGATTSADDVGLLSPVLIGAGDAASDRVVLAHLVGAELALTRALVAAGLAPQAAGIAVDGVRRNPPAIDLGRLARDSVAGGNPVIPLIPLIKASVAQQDQDAAAWVHVGATSQDILDSALMTVGRDVAVAVAESLSQTADALARLVRAHRDDPAAARTLTQHGVPTTLGLKAANWLRAVDRARHRLDEAASRLPAQLGGAGGTLAAFVERFGAAAAADLPARYAHELGLQAPAAPWHTDRWPVTELGDALAAVVAAVGMFGSDIAGMARTEVAEAAVAEGGGSSAMPQKQNPVDAVLLRSAAMRAPGLAAQLHLAAGLAVDERPDGAWHAEWPALQELLRLTLGASARAAHLAAGLSLDAGRARENLDLTNGLIVSERLGIVLVPLIGKARFDSLIVDAAAGGDLAGLLRALPEASALDVGELVDPARYLGLAPALADAALRRAPDATDAFEEGPRP